MISHEEEIREIIDSSMYYTNDYTQEFASFIYFAKCLNKPICLYGDDVNIRMFIKLLRYENVEVECIIRDKKMETCSSIDGVDIVDIDCFTNRHRIDACIILNENESKNAENGKRNWLKHVLRQRGNMTSGMRDYDEIKRSLSRVGISIFYTLTNHDKDLIFRDFAKAWDGGRIDYYDNHLAELCKVYALLEDVKSKEIFKEYLKTYCENKTYSLEQTRFSYKYWYGSNDKEELYRHDPNEVFINCGAGFGETVFAFLSEGLEYKHIYAVDSDTNALEKLRKKLQILDKTTQQKVSVESRFISSADDIRDLCQKDRVTLINADIEGNELEMLNGIVDLIKEDRPVLAICVYHRMGDLVDIPLMLSNQVSGYTFYLRKYVSSSNCKKQNNELVFFAVPNERKV